MTNDYKSRVYTDRPAYADFDAPAKFQAIQSIVAKHLKQHPKCNRRNPLGRQRKNACGYKVTLTIIYK